MKLVGVTGHVDEKKNILNYAYSTAFTRKNVTPVIIPVFKVDNLESLTQKEFNILFQDHISYIVERLDGLVISGGADLNPLYRNGEENVGSYSCDTLRDFTETALLDAFVKAKKPVMGICRGLQLIGNYLKLDYFQQDISSADELHSGSSRSFEDRQEPCHDVMVYGDLKKYIFGNSGGVSGEILNVNSFHHQGFTYKLNGKALEDKQYEKETSLFESKFKVNILASTRAILEAFETKDKKIFAVQWHPEEYGASGKTIGYFVDKLLNNKEEVANAVVTVETKLTSLA